MKLLYYIIIYFLIAFNASCMCPKIRCNWYCRKFLGLNMALEKEGMIYLFIILVARTVAVGIPWNDREIKHTRMMTCIITR